MRTASWLRGVGFALVLVTLTSGCNTIGIRYIGIRPDAPDVRPSQEAWDLCKDLLGTRRPPAVTSNAEIGPHASCARFYQVVNWANHLVESYRSRATMNEWSIYAAGAIALGALSTLAGLAVVGQAASTTAGLVSVSSGFTSGFFGFLDNKTRAGFYTKAAKDIAEAKANAVNAVIRASAADAAATYQAQTATLYVAVTTAVAWLEDQRKDAAVAANAAAQNEKITHLYSLLLATSVTAMAPTECKEGEEVTLTVSGADLTTFKNAVKVMVGDKVFDPEEVKSTTVRFKVPTGTGTGDKPVALKIGNLSFPAGGKLKVKT